jgi:hypothetical protein
MEHMDELKEYIEKHVVSISWGEYGGINDLSISQLGALKALINAALAEKMRRISTQSDNDD